MKDVEKEKTIVRKILNVKDDLDDEVSSLQDMIEKDINIMKKEILKLKQKETNVTEEGEKTSLSNESFKCDKCNFSGEDQCNLILHKEVYHGEWFQCDRCKFRTNDQAHFKRHKETFVHRSNNSV